MSHPTRPDALSDLLGTPVRDDEDSFHTLLAEHPTRCTAIASVYEAMYGKRLAWLSGATQLSAGLPSRHPAMSDDFVAGLDLCAGHCAATGWRELSTTTVFQVYRWTQPWVVAALPEGALRDVEEDYTGQRKSFFQEDLLLSACVRKSIAGLCRTGIQVTFHDLFFDLARFGGGRSVQVLRDHGVGQDALDGFARRMGIGLNSRHGRLDRIARRARLEYGIGE